MLYKSKSLTLVPIGYSLIHSWDIFIEYSFWAQEAVCNQVIDVRTGYMQVCIWVELPVQRRLCPIFVKNVRLPDIHEHSAG